MADKIISESKLKRALNALKSKFISTKGGTLSGNLDMSVNSLRFNTQGGYKPPFGIISGYTLKLGSDGFPVALYTEDSSTRPQWVYSEGAGNHSFKELAVKEDIPNKQMIVEMIYPVGAIYMSVKSTSPASLFGGTWEVWGSGRVPIGVNASDSDFNTVEKTGGTKINRIGFLTAGNNYGLAQGGGYGGKPLLNEYQGDGGYIYKEFSILQPYITCYMWKRIS